MDSGKKKLDGAGIARANDSCSCKKKIIEYNGPKSSGTYYALVSLGNNVKKGVHLECGSSVPAMRRHHPGI